MMFLSEEFEDQLDAGPDPEALQYEVGVRYTVEC